MMRPILLSIFAASFVTVSLPAQDSISSLGILADLEGEWAGEAWIILGPDGKHLAHQREIVRTVAGGTAMTVQGLGTETLPDGSSRLVHDAFAIIHLAKDGKTPLMRAFTPAGWGDMDLTIRRDGYTWLMTDPRAGEIRYEMSLDEQGRWVEKGYLSRDAGKSSVQFFEMTLSRVK